MKLATIQSKKEIFYGLIKDEGFIALNEKFPEWNSLKDVIVNNGFNKIEKFSQKLTVTHKNEDFSYMIPILNPEKIICVGINYPELEKEKWDIDTDKIQSMADEAIEEYTKALEKLENE